MKPVIQTHILEEGVKHWSDMAKALNEEILEHGEIQKNNKTIWDNYLHQWTNWEYATVLGVMRDLMDSNPEYFRGNHESAILTAETVLMRNWESEKDRVLDQRRFKEVAWKLIMTMREVWNRVQGIDLPNSDQSRRRPPPPKDQLFSVGE